MGDGWAGWVTGWSGWAKCVYYYRVGAGGSRVAWVGHGWVWVGVRVGLGWSQVVWVGRGWVWVESRQGHPGGLTGLSTFQGPASRIIIF